MTCHYDYYDLPRQWYIIRVDESQAGCISLLLKIDVLEHRGMMLLCQ